MSRSGAIRRFGAFLLVAVAATALRSFQVSAQPAKGNAAAAKPVFAQKCIACHKPDGSGGVKLTGNPTPNWKDPKTWADPKRKDLDAYLRDCITNGKVKSGMVAWGKAGQMKPQQIEDMIAFIKMFKK